MNILVVAPTPFFSHRGTPMRIFDQVRSIARLGHRVTITTYHVGENPDFGEVADKVAIKRIPRLLFWYKKTSAGPSWQKIILDVLLMGTIIRELLINKYDVIHAHHHEGVTISFLVTKILFWKKVKILGDFHGDMVGEMVDHGYLNIGIMRKFFKKIETLIYRLPDRIITSSQGMSDSIFLQNPKQIIGCIHDGGDVVVCKPSVSQREQLKNDLGIPDQANLIVYTGGFTADKGLDNFLVSLNHSIMESIENLYICLAGSPYHQITSQVHSHKLREKIIILDQFKSSRVDELLSLATIVVDPKDEDGFQASGKMVRYIMAGVPIVCFNTRVNRSYLGEGYPFASLTDQDSFAQKIHQMISDPLMCKQAVDWVRSRQKLFRYESLARALEYEYLQLCTK